MCSVMDPLKLSYEARVHASQNKRLPVQIVLHALYYDQLRLRSGADDGGNAVAEREQLQTDVTLVRENEELGKLNPFRNGSKDTTHLEDGPVDLTKPTRRRFSIS